MKTRNTIITILFICLLAVIPLGTIIAKLTPSEDSMSGEGGDEFAAEEENWDDITWKVRWDAFIHDGVNAFVDANPFKEPVIKANYALTKFLSGGTYMESTQVLLGKEGWLFYKTTTDGAPIKDYKGSNLYTEEELDRIYGNMLKAKEVMNSQGREFNVLLIPNKESVYAEYLPDTVGKKNNYTRYSQLIDRLEKEGQIDYLDMTEALEANKEGHQLYFRTDTHWTRMGAFLGLQTYFDRYYGNSESIDTVLFSEESGYSGDLARIANVEEYFKETDYDFVTTSADYNLYRDQVIFIVGDSFGEMMIPIARVYYREAHFIRTEDFTMSLMDEYNPDVVVWESVERYLSKVKDNDITSK